LHHADLWERRPVTVGALDAILFRNEEVSLIKPLLNLEIIMDLTLMNLKRYAIDNRVEIRFAEPGSNSVCIISNTGLVKIPAHTENIRIEDVLATAQSFEIVAKDKPQKLTRARMGETITETFKKRNFVSVKEEED
jgi:hypothetical protein